jgi:signal transduction histidine kinase
MLRYNAARLNANNGFSMMTTHDKNAYEHKIAILTRLTEISASLNSNLKLKPLLSIIMEAAAEIVDAEAASVLLWDAKANELRFASTTTDSQTLIGSTVPLEGSIAGTVMRENRVVVVEDAVRDPRHYTKVDQDLAFVTRSILGVPMHSKSRVIGVLEAINKRNLPWTTDDVQYLTTLASQAAVAIESAQLVAALRQANEELSQVDKLKSDFIAIASHELRTPLGVILGYASFIQDTDDPEVRAHAAKVVGSAMQLRRIIEDLTNLRFIDQKESELNFEHVPLASFLNEIAQEAFALAEAKRHRFLYNAPDDKVTVKIDRIRMGMAITNVLNNAVRFTPEFGRIILSVELRGHEVWISVIDNGIGLEPDQLERIFERFYQVEDHMTRKQGGMGIGLSIARALIEAHGGRIWAESRGLNQGTTVTTALPLAD